MKTTDRTVEEEHDEGLEAAWGDVSGAALEPKMVKAARRQEIEFAREMQSYDTAPAAECKRATGQMQIMVRCVDISKGDRGNPNYRSNIVAR